MPLTDREIRVASTPNRPRKLWDGLGLFLLLHPNGSRYWRFKYVTGGREKLLSLGQYPSTSLKDARSERDRLRGQIARGIDPAAERAAQKEATSESFEAVANEWFKKESSGWVEGHAKRVERLIKKDLAGLASRPIAEIKAPEVLKVVQRVVDRGAIETAHRALRVAGQVMRYAIATGRAESDPTPALKGALPSPKVEHFAAATTPGELGDVLRAIDGYKGSPIVRAALRIAPHVALRPGELRRGEWAEIDFEAEEGPVWAIPASRMKTDAAHMVPLSPQSVAILREIEPLTGRSQYIFPSARSYHRPMSENAVLAALRRLGYEKLTGHGFRATFRTLADEALHCPPHLIEHQLAHVVRDPLGRAYNRTTHLEDRRAMMVRWSDYLDSLRTEEKLP